MPGLQSTRISRISTNWQFLFTFAVVLMLSGCYLLGALTRTFRFYNTTVGKHTDYQTEAWALVPTDREDTVPVVVYLHGSGGSLQKSGTTLRTIVDQGYAAVGLEYSQRNNEHSHRQLCELLDWITTQSWARQDAIVWMGLSLGAQRYLDYFTDGSHSPSVLIRIAGGTLPKLKDGFPRPPSAPVWMIHGEHDRVFPLADAKKLKLQLERAGGTVRLDVLPRKPHGLKRDRLVVIKMLIERLKQEL